MRPTRDERTYALQNNVKPFALSSRPLLVAYRRAPFNCTRPTFVPSLRDVARDGDRCGGYRRERYDTWVLWVDAARWRPGWWAQLVPQFTAPEGVVARSRHARTVRVTLADDVGTTAAYFKLYHDAGWTTVVKDLWRRSKARQAWRMSVRLAADGFDVPHVLAVGERRNAWRRRAFILTAAVEWLDLAQSAIALAATGAPDAWRRRRAVLVALGDTVGRFHARGYVHGDLVVNNILVSEGPPVRLCFIDHDRSRRADRVGAARQQRRNLVQLNRVVLPAVHDSDRLRAFVSYARARGWNRDRWRAEARWLARRTLERRQELGRPARWVDDGA